MKRLTFFIVCCVVTIALNASNYKITTNTSSSLTGETGVTCIEFPSLDYIKNGWIEAGKPSKLKIKGPVYGSYSSYYDFEIATTITYLDLSEAIIDGATLNTSNFSYISSQENDDEGSLKTLVLPSTITELYVSSLAYYDGGGHYSIQDVYTTSTTPFYVRFHNEEGYFHVPEGYKDSWGSQQDILATIVDSPVKTVSTTAGNLVSQLTATERQTIDALIIKGEINAKDFALLKTMPDLNDLRIEASMEDYDGTEGPNSEEYMSYFANEIPSYAFQNNHNLKKITFSNANYPYLSVGDYAFDGCNSLTYFNAILKGRIGDFAFRNTNLKSIKINSYVNTIGEYNQEIKGVTNVEVIPVSA